MVLDVQPLTYSGFSPELLSTKESVCKSASAHHSLNQENFDSTHQSQPGNMLLRPLELYLWLKYFCLTERVLLLGVSG